MNGLVLFRLDYVGNTVGKICFVFDFILHTLSLIQNIADWIIIIIIIIILIIIICKQKEVKLIPILVSASGIVPKTLFNSFKKLDYHRVYI
jgi:hypothetical protein